MPWYDKEFPLDEGFIHLNHAAVAPWPQRTVEAVKRFAEENMTVGSWNYPAWITVETKLRQQIATLINAPTAADIALVKNTSEALSFVAGGIDWHAGDNIVISDQEFPSNRIVWEALASQGVEIRTAELNKESTAEDSLFSRVDTKTRMIAVSSVQYGTGLRMDLQRIGDFCKSNEILFCVDAIQSVGAVEFDVVAINADFVAADGHKWMLGPEGLGFFYVRPQLRDSLKLTQYGWHMIEDVGNFDLDHWQPAASARRFECGSPNMLAIHALSASLSLLLEVGMKQVETRLLANSRYLIEQLSQFESLKLVSPTSSGRYAGIVNFSVNRHDSAAMQQQLMSNRIFCAYRAGGIRLSPHFYTSNDSLDAALSQIERLIN